MKLTRPICFFDIEGTGLDTSKDRIVTIKVTKVNPDGTTDSRFYECNPGIPISPEASEKNGYTDAMVADFQPFIEYASPLHEFIKGCDLGGYNLRNYDIPLLYAEFERCFIDWDLTGIHAIDAGAIFKKKEARTLSAALQFYCGRELKDAHTATADVEATISVLAAQCECYADLTNMTVEQLSEFSKMDDRLDLAGKIGRDKDGDATFLVGNPRGRKVRDDISFAYWMLDKDFPSQTKKVLQGVLDELSKGDTNP